MSNASFTNKSDMSGNTVTILDAGKPSPLTEEKEKNSSAFCIILKLYQQILSKLN